MNAIKYILGVVFIVILVSIILFLYKDKDSNRSDLELMFLGLKDSKTCMIFQSSDANIIRNDYKERLNLLGLDISNYYEIYYYARNIKPLGVDRLPDHIKVDYSFYRKFGKGPFVCVRLLNKSGEGGNISIIYNADSLRRVFLYIPEFDPEWGDGDKNSID